MIKFFIEKSLAEPEIHFLLRTWAKNTKNEISFTNDSAGAISVGKYPEHKLEVSNRFASDHINNSFLDSRGFITSESKKPDYLTTAFYLLNSQQEFNDPDPDELGRFRYKNSYQNKLQNSRDNIVQQCFNEISKICGIKPPQEKSTFFLSHDIDLVYGAILEDGFNVIKKGRIDLFLKMLINVALQKPDWLNMDKIMSLESMYDCKSVFYWIVNKGRINKREINADYTFNSRGIQKNFQLVKKNGFENGIHKSISSESFMQEIEKFGEMPIGNRYHYLKFHLPDAYHTIDEAGLKLDASLGFAEEIGFRNNYGLPFNPYNFKTRKPFSFVEVPLHIMDRTFFQYKRSTVQEAEKDIFDFLEKNRENCVLSVLWHNNFFTNYKFKGYLDLYKKILAYIRDQQFSTITQEEIIKTYSIA